MPRWKKSTTALLEAAADLGCPRWKAFWLVTLPLALPGVIAGALLCFIPIVGEFVIPDLLGGSRSLMIGQTLWTEFFGNKDWPVASAAAIVLLALLRRADRDLSEHAGAKLKGWRLRCGAALRRSTSPRSRSALRFSICRWRSW